MSEEGKSRGFVFPGDQQLSHPQPPYYYGTFQGVANHQPYPPPPPTYQPPLGFPQPIPPPHNVHINPPYYAHGYQTVPGVVVVPGRPVLIERTLPFCGCGIGWFLFFIGFFFGAIPWYIGAFIILCVRVDYREKPGLVACMIASFLAFIAIGLGVQRVRYGW